MIGETQPEMEFLEVAVVYSFSLKAGCSVPSATRISFFSTASLAYLCSSKFFFKSPVES